MAFKRYKHLNVPDSWERYFTKYPQGMSILESLFEWVSQVDNMVDNQNTLTTVVETYGTRLDEFLGRFDSHLRGTVEATLMDWQSSGFLDVLINAALQWQLDGYIATNEQDKLAINQQLIDKVGGGKKAELEDLSDNVLGAIDGSGTFNLLSEPQDYSVGLDKFAYETREALSNLFTFGDVTSIFTMPPNAQSFTSDSTADRVFILDKPIDKDTFIYNIKFRSLVTGTIKFLLLSKSGASFSVVKEFTSARTIGENTLSLNYHATEELYFGWYPFQNDGLPYAAQEAEDYNGHWYQINGNQFGTFTPTHQTNTSLSFAIEIAGRPLSFTNKGGTTSNEMTVGVGKEYSTIMEAVNNANDNKNNPVTIVVYPGVYEEVVLLYGERNISIVGTNRNTCILRDDSGLYENSPLRVSGNSYIANMTVIATHDNAPSNWLPSEGLADKTNWPAYAVHVDDSNGENGDLFLCHFHNCVFYSEQSAAAGCGTHEGQKLLFTSCEFETNVPDTIYNASSKSRNGAVFLHARQRANTNNQHFILKDCIAKSNKDEVFRLQSVGAEYDANLKMSFYNNILYSATLGKADSVFVNDAPQAVITPDSFGNNVNALNQ